MIELLIAVGITAILAAIAVPAYSAYRTRANEGACQAEMVNYARFALAQLHDNRSPPAPPLRACSDADNAVAIGTDITATPQLAASGARSTICSMVSGNCILL